MRKFGSYERDQKLERALDAIWSFRRKRAPIKHKARLCAHGGMQIEGEHFWETYSPVVQMTTVRLLLRLYTHFYSSTYRYQNLYQTINWLHC